MLTKLRIRRDSLVVFVLDHVSIDLSSSASAELSDLSILSPLQASISCFMHFTLESTLLVVRGQTPHSIGPIYQAGYIPPRITTYVGTSCPLLQQPIYGLQDVQPTTRCSTCGTS
eukprot:scaffold4570_cov81-Cylindrotheca_fusiformis.AAC.3